jgi:UDP-N-acetyl-D-mannosaminuronic acid dehydrogenase
MPPTDDLRGTMAKPILASLREVFPDAIFRGFDPVASTEDAKAYLGIDTVNSIGEAFEGANIVVIANNHPMFQNMDIASSARMMAKPGIIYDFWSLHDDVEGSMPVEVDYMTLGSERMGKVS